MVDIVHHSLIGVAGAGVANALGQHEAAIGFLIGSLLPDLDVLFIPLGKSRFLNLHQGVTHSLIGITGISCLAAAIFTLVGMPFAVMACAIAAGMAVHVALDLLNTFGVRVLWPLPQRICFDAFFFIDIYVLVASWLFAAAAIGTEMGGVVAVVWIAFLAAYSAVRIAWRKAIIAKHGLTTAVPSGALPLTWFVTKRENDLIRCGVVEGLSRRLRWTSEVAEVDRDLLKVLRSGPIFKDLEKALKLFVPVKVDSDGDVTTVVSRCVAVRNFNNRYGETTSVIQKGVVISEVSRI
jgi:Predicted membrane-bound metal-dependent hydrolases